METQIKILKNIKLKRPILIEGLPVVGNVGRLVAGYLINEMKAKKFAEMTTPHVLPLAVLDKDSVAHMLMNEFYYVKQRTRDIIIFTGDSQAITGIGHYEIADAILKFAKQFKVKDIITIGGFATEQEKKNPKVIGAVSDKKLLTIYKKHNIIFDKNHPIGTIVGASGLLCGMAPLYKMNALCLMGETMGFPIITDPKASESVLQILKSILKIKVDLRKIEKAVKDMEEQLKRTEKIHRKILEETGKPENKEQMKYIG